jgi:uncharacterized protein (UPF0333 family)
MGNNKGQSTLEYILLVTAVLVVIIAFVAGPTSPFKKAVNKVLVEGSAEMAGQGAKIANVLN